MPNNLCRACGGDLTKWSSCSECRKVIQKICTTCSIKTTEEFHSHHVHLEPYQIVNAKNQVATVQSYHDPLDSKVTKKKKSHKKIILVVSCIIVGIIILSVFGTNHPESFSDPKPTQIKTTITSESPNIIQKIMEDTNQSPQVMVPPIITDTKYTYNNCLGVSDGTYLTVTCPTTYGNVYKAVVQIPAELMSQFENNIFNLRGLSVTEHVDSISIHYAKKMYEAKFVNS
ncbi:MAG TPA: hypothetical protein VFA69_09915 [Candidatus Nitrosotalea sp.]|nr:hypothetical protein [Candidatus Nitrosotalea sp.]